MITNVIYIDNKGTGYDRVVEDTKGLRCTGNWTASKRCIYS